MSNSQSVSIRIPPAILNKIDALAQQQYTSHRGVPNRSLVILDAIVAYLAIERGGDTISAADFNALKQEVAQIKSVVVRQSLSEDKFTMEEG